MKILGSRIASLESICFIGTQDIPIEIKAASLLGTARPVDVGISPASGPKIREK